MNIHKIKTAFQALCKTLSPEIDDLLPQDGISGMIKFYQMERVKKCDITNDGDMLLFEWGTYSFTGQKEFQINITRQFILSREDEPYQLSLRFTFPINERNQSWNAGSFWCHGPEEVHAFLSQIENNLAFHEMRQQKATRVELTFGQC